MNKALYVLICALALLTACDDTTDTLGSSLTKNEDVITVTDGIYKITSRSVVVDSVLARNTTGYLGNVKDPETGTYIKSNFLTQFHTFEDYVFPEKERLSKGIVADSCELRLYYDSFYGDSLTSMKATLYEMQKPVEENQRYYSSFDPEANGFVRIDGNAINVKKIYTLANGNFSDSLRNSSGYVNNITFKLNKPYTDRNGKTYSNYGTYIMQQYYDHPEYFRNSYSFIHNVCPGFYIKHENGVGCMAYIYLTQLNTYFTYKDSVDHSGVANFSGTEEVRQLTQTTNDRKRINELAADNSCTYIKSPAGIFTELTLPVEEICKNHENDSINSAKVVLKCLNNTVGGEYAFNVPTTILMIKASDAKNFFENNKIADYRSTFIATYSATTNSYTFNNIGELVKSMYAAMQGSISSPETWKQNHPDWNKVLLIPVNASYTNSNGGNVLSRIAHDMSLSSVRLIGGSENPYEDLEVSVIYSKFAK